MSTQPVVLGGGGDLKKQLWRNNFLAIHQRAHVDPIDKLLITKSIAMNFHCCQTEGLPGEWSPRDLVLTFRTPSSSPVLPSTPAPPLSLTPPHYQSSGVWKQIPTISIFIFQRCTKQGKTPRWPGQTLIRVGQVLPPQKRPVNSSVPSSYWNKRGPSLPDTHSIRLNTFYWQPLCS